MQKRASLMGVMGLVQLCESLNSSFISGWYDEPIQIGLLVCDFGSDLLQRGKKISHNTIKFGVQSRGEVTNDIC